MAWVKKFAGEVLNDKNFCLDVGCAEGWYTKWMSGKANFTIGIDISLSKLRRAVRKSNNSKTSYIQANWDNLPFKDSGIDVVLFSEGPEHSSNPATTLHEIARAMKRHGYLVISGPIGSGEKMHHDLLFNHGHLREFTPASFRKLVKNKFDIVKEHYSAQPKTKNSFLKFYSNSLETVRRRIIQSRFESLVKFIPSFLRRMVYRIRVVSNFGLILSKKR